MDWRTFVLAFGLLFLAELGDKTQLAVFTLVCQNGSPLAVFLGASLALTVVTFLAVVGGQFVTRVIPVYFIQMAAGLMFVGIGLVVLWQAFSGLARR